MRIITDENVDQLLSMSYSNNINKLLHKADDTNVAKMDALIKEYARDMADAQKRSYDLRKDESPELPTPLDVADVIIDPKVGVKVVIINGPHKGEHGIINGYDKRNKIAQLELDDGKIVIERAHDLSPIGITSEEVIIMPNVPAPSSATPSPEWAPGSSSPSYDPNAPGLPPYSATTEQASPPYSATTEQASPPYSATTGQVSPPYSATTGQASPPYAPGTNSEGTQASSILEVPKEPDAAAEDKTLSPSSTDSGEKKVIEMTADSSSEAPASDGTKKITL